MKNLLRLAALLVTAFLVYDYLNWKRQHDTGAPGYASEAAPVSQASAAPQTTAPAAFTPDPRATAFTKALLHDDFETWDKGGDSSVAWKWKRPIDMEVKASTLMADYDANEVSADEKYKGQTLGVTGTIQEIGKDAFGNVFISLGSRGAFNSVHSFLSDEAARTAGQLVKGKAITLVCTGMGMVVGSPIVKGCEYLDAIVEAQVREIAIDVDWMLNGRPNRRDAEFARTVAFAYLWGLQLPASFTCWESGSLSDSCIEELPAVLKDRTKEQWAADYAALAKVLTLPPPPTPPATPATPAR